MTTLDPYKKIEELQRELDQCRAELQLLKTVSPPFSTELSPPDGMVALHLPKSCVPSNSPVLHIPPHASEVKDPDSPASVELLRWENQRLAAAVRQLTNANVVLKTLVHDEEVRAERKATPLCARRHNSDTGVAISAAVELANLVGVSRRPRQSEASSSAADAVTFSCDPVLTSLRKNIDPARKAEHRVMKDQAYLWVCQVLDLPLKRETFLDDLRSGVLLCALLRKISPRLPLGHVYDDAVVGHFFSRYD